MSPPRCSPRPATCTSAPASCWSARSGPGWPALLAAARAAAGATTSLDTNWDPAGRWGDGQLRASLAQADVAAPQRDGGDADLAGRADAGSRGGALTAAGPRAVVKLGERGAFCADGPVWHRVELAPVTPVTPPARGIVSTPG